MNNLVKKGRPELWGEDPHRSLVAARRSGEKGLILLAEDEVLRQYRLRIRKEFEQNAGVISVLEASKPARSASDEIGRILSHLVRDESSDLFAQALHELLDELDEMRKKPGSMYLVETDTGKATLPIGPQHVYTPPDFMGEDGKLHKSQPILHPGLTAPIVQRKNDDARTAAALAKGGEKSALALEHLKDPDAVRNKAVESLAELGVSADLEAPARTVLVEFGREQADGALQSLNPRFHRAHVFGKILARRIVEELGGGRTCSVVSVEQKRNSKKRWYVATVGLP